MEKEQAWVVAQKLYRLQGNETIPSEDVIDLAGAVLYLLERVDGEAPDHATKDCWLAGNDGHLYCTAPVLRDSPDEEKG